MQSGENQKTKTDGNLSIKRILAELDAYIKKIEENLKAGEETERASEKRMKIILAATAAFFIFLSAGIGIYGLVSNAILNKIMPLQESSYKRAPMNTGGADMQKTLREINDAIHDYRKTKGEYPDSLSEIKTETASDGLMRVNYKKTEDGFILKSTDGNAGNVSYNQKGIVLPFKNMEEK